jgi:hypothetical protein
MVVHTIGYLQFSFGEEKLVAPLIATPNVDNANRRPERKKNAKLQAMRNSYVGGPAGEFPAFFFAPKNSRKNPER